MESLVRDLRSGVRGLLKTPGFSIVALGTLALGIGANTTIFSIVNTVLLKALPYPNGDRLVILDESRLEHGSRTVSWLDFNDWKKQNTAFEDLAAFRLSHVSLTGIDRPDLLRAGEVSVPFFKMLGAQPFKGRLFNEADETPGGRPVAIASHEFWINKFGADSKIDDKVLTLDGIAYSVIGVLPPKFQFFDRGVDVYLPVGLHGSDPEWKQRSTHPDLLVLGKLSPGTSLDAGRSGMNVIMHRLQQEHPESNTGLVATVTSLYQYRYGATRTIFLTLFAAVGSILLIACANVGNLLLARGVSRRKELAIRVALGASRRRLIRQLVTESLLLALLGGASGTLLAFVVLHAIVSSGPQNIPNLAETRIDGTVLLFTLAVSLLTGLLFGAFPALEATVGDVNNVLTETGRSGGSGRRATIIRSALVIGEISIALTLVTASTLVIGSLRNAVMVNPGFAADHLLTMDLFLAPNRYTGVAEKRQLFRQAVDRLRSAPGVRDAGAALCPPLVGVCEDSAFMLLDHPVKSVVDLPTAASNIVVPGYFETMQIPVLEGRLFTDSDNENSGLVVIVNQMFAHRYWPQGTAVGKRLREGGPTGGQPYREIIGVVADVKQTGLDIDARPEVFLPSTQFPFAPWTPLQAMTFVIRTKADPRYSADAVRNELSSMDKDLPITRIHPATDYISESLERRRFVTILLGTFATLALLLSAIGTYGVMAYDVSQKLQEISIRIALGASSTRIRNMVLGKAVSLALFGVAIGSLATLFATRWITSLLFGVRATDPVIFASASTLLILVSIAASYVPIRRAMAVDPLTALRSE